MNITNTSGLLLSAVFLFGCGSDSNDADNPGGSSSDGRFTPVTVDEEIVMRDKTTGLEWVNGLAQGSTKTETGCHPMAPGLSTDGVLADAQNFCEALSFGAYSDWRLPAVAEIKKYTVDMGTAGLIPFYQNAGCPRVVGIETTGTTKTIKTINTHNTNPIGEVNDWSSKNAGARCVRKSN